jgi:ATP-dependent Clp protease adaptor protein ClpS
MHNDDVTPQDLVQHILESVFGFPSDEATQTIWSAHEDGSAIITTAPREEAIALAHKAVSMARTARSPLRLTLEASTRES